MTCDAETGLCEIPAVEGTIQETDISAHADKIRLLYFTDPICSSCWGIEPQLRKLKLEYGDYFEVDYRMGGLLKSWDSYGGSDVSNPADVAVHWDEASDHYQMPINGDLWLEDPLDSSYPASIAFKAAQMQGTDKADDFLRKIKEMVFLEKKNISKWEHLREAAIISGLDVVKFKTDFDGAANTAFKEDLALGAQLGVRGFPTIFFTDKEDNRFKVYGAKPYEVYEQALLKLIPDAVKKPVDTSLHSLFEYYPTLTTKEAGVLSDQSLDQTEAALELLHEQNIISKYSSKKGILWSKND
jgi:putative protein-disulfide isomerase